MSTDAVAIIREAYEAYAEGDLATMLSFMDPDLEWTFLDPTEQDPAPRVCHGRHELEVALERQTRQGLRVELEEVVGSGNRAVVVLRIPDIDAFRARKADDRNFDVVTVKDGRIVAIRACLDRREADSRAEGDEG